MFKEIFDNVREKKPLIHSITNYVTINDCANIVLACGASPIMAESPDESAQITSLCDGLNLNMGMPTAQKTEAMLLSARAASRSAWSQGSSDTAPALPHALQHLDGSTHGSRRRRQAVLLHPVDEDEGSSQQPHEQPRSGHPRGQPGVPLPAPGIPAGTQIIITVHHKLLSVRFFGHQCVYTFFENSELEVEILAPLW